MLGNEALLRYRLGDVSGALLRQYDSLLDLRSMGESSFALQGLIRAGLCFHAFGDFDVAEALLVYTIEESHRTNQTSEFTFGMHHLARLDIAREDWDGALSKNTEASKAGRESGFHALDLEMGILAARVALGRENPSRALTAIEQLEAVERPDNEVAALRYERWLITGDELDREAAATAYRSRHDLAPSAHTARRLGRLTGIAIALPEVAGAGGDPPAPDAFLEFLR